MNATTYAQPDDGWDDYDEDTGALSGRPRRRFLNRWSALLMALVLGAVGFFIGVRVEKGQLSSSSTGNGAAAAFRRLSGSAAGGTGGASKTGAAARFGGFGAAGGATIGTVASVNGRTIYVTETGGNTVKVKLSSATKLTKSETVGRSKINPGDSVVITGVSGSRGTIDATSLSDSGASSSTSSTSSSSSSSSAVSSLFGG